MIMGGYGVWSMGHGVWEDMGVEICSDMGYGVTSTG